MLSDMFTLAANFRIPEEIGTNPQSMLWMFPLLASIALVYKATKMRVFHIGKFFKQVAILFFTLSIVMIAAGLVLHVIVRILTG